MRKSLFEASAITTTFTFDTHQKNLKMQIQELEAHSKQLSDQLPFNFHHKIKKPPMRLTHRR